MLQVAPEKKKVTYVTLLADESIHPRYEEALKQVERDFGKHHPMYINGRQVLATGGEFEVHSPLDSTILLGYFQNGTAEFARKALEAASEHFEAWSSMPWRKRVEILKKAADLIIQRQFYLAALITYEVAKNRYEAIAEVNEAADFLHYYARVMEENEGYVKPMERIVPGENSKSVLRPHGVWAVVSPFNFPIALATTMITGALITGNTVVFKPTSEAPWTALKLYEILVEAGVPGGVINFVTGPGSAFGPEFSSNPLVAGIAFTGSKDVGMQLYRDFVNKQAYPKPFIAEMGSKNPAIVTAKADLDRAAEGVVRAAFGYDGQKCSATSRVYVERGVKEDFLRVLKAKTEKIAVVGDPRQKPTFVGPVIDEKAFRNYQKAIETVKKDGGRIVAGGEVPKMALPKGYYVTPTVVTGLPSDHRLFKEELFVPFVAVDEVKSLEEGLAKANQTEFGLTAGVFTKDARERDEFFKDIRFGVVYSNRKGGATTGAWPGAQPFGGWKGSGATGKGAGGPYYLLQFMHEQAQTIVEDA
jgi:1-pyrroline-5-carboxylate dehydrogenase